MEPHYGTLISDMLSEPTCRIAPKGRLIAVGDIHGNEEGFLQILRLAALINTSGDWVGENAVLVLTGDVIGRGGRPRHIYSRIRRLARQAMQSKGRVEFLLGNHEALAMHDIHNYTTLQEYQDFAPAAAGAFDKKLREAYQDLPRPEPSASPIDLGQLQAEPLGWIELRRAMAPSGMVGRWLSCRNSIFKVGQILFVHGGMHPRWGCAPIEELNHSIREEISRQGTYFDLNSKHFALSEDGPHWYRIGLREPEDTLRQHLDEVLTAQHAVRMIVGHTPTYLHDPHRTGRIVSKCGGRLLCVDTGIGRAYGAHLSAVEFLPDGNVRAFYPDGEELL